MDFKKWIRNVPDFPKPGIMFRDITPLIAAPDAFGACIDQLAERFQDSSIDSIIAAEARGFIFAAPLALRLNKPFVPVRKPGKLPFDRIRYSYDLEYGSDTLELHSDALKAGDKVLLVDDLLATGGTIGACRKLAEMSGAEVVACAFIIELSFLNGREKLDQCDVFSLVKYHDET